MFARTFIAGAVLTLLVGGLVSPAAAQAEEPVEEEISLLFTSTAKSGTLMPREADGRFTLTLRKVSRQVVWFSDRPARAAGQIGVRKFVQDWDGFGFTEDPPNAALTLLSGHHERDTVVLELGAPRYLKKTRGIRFPAQLLGEASGNLAHFEARRDGRVPRRFGHAALFVDDAAGSVINGCLIQPHTSCMGADLRGASLAGAQLQGAWLNGSDLSGANLSDVDLSYTNLAGVNLSGANLTSANIFYANLKGVNLTSADLSFADFAGSDLTNADLTGAIIENAVFYYATFCGTTMPSGEVYNTNC